VTWHRRHTSGYSGYPLDDPRVRIIVGDLGGMPLEERAYDAVLLDTDNGPDWLALDGNARLYDEPGIARMLRLLRPGGVAAYWSASPSLSFVRRLPVSAAVESIEVDDQVAPGRTAPAVLYLIRPAS
jgi:spermidine synthase